MNILTIIYKKIGVAGICGWAITALAWTNPIQTKSFSYIAAVILFSYLYVYTLRKIFPDKLKKKDLEWWNEPVHVQLDNGTTETIYGKINFKKGVN